LVTYFVVSFCVCSFVVQTVIYNAMTM